MAGLETSGRLVLQLQQEEPPTQVRGPEQHLHQLLSALTNSSWRRFQGCTSTYLLFGAGARRMRFVKQLG